MLTSNDNYNIPNTSYVNKDFQTIYPELLNIIKELTYRWDPTITDESDPLIVLVKLNALIADKCNYNIDTNVLETSPLTVAQMENARPLFEQLGYNMKWYQAAKSQVSLRWKDEIVRQDDEENGVVANYKNQYTLPRFTTFSDVDNNYVYTSIEDVIIVADNSIRTCDVLQGTPVQLKINDSDIISYVNLDANNRIYFPDYNVAENGIFIESADETKDDFNTWKKVDNLYVQNLGQTVYKFGVDRRQRYCYIEFPEDVASLMGAGIKITYIKTDGYDGNIGANTLSKLFVDVEAKGKNKNGSDVESYKFTEENLYVQNLVSSWGGKDPETITDAYRNYKKVSGTFNTLVSLRDYINYFVSTQSVSNCVVCDRTNDIQTAYKVMTYENGIYKRNTQFDTGDKKIFWNDVLENPEASKTFQITFQCDNEEYSHIEFSFLSNEFFVNYLTLENNPIRAYSSSDGGWVNDKYKTISYNPDTVSDIELKEYISQNSLTIQEQENLVNPFDLKLYALQWVDDISSTSTYAASFDILDYYSDDVDTYGQCRTEYNIVQPDSTILSQEENDDSLQTVKLMSHNFIPYQAEKMVLLKNKYPLTIKIVPQYKLTDLQVKEVKDNITHALVTALNSQKINFGETPEYDFIYQTIQDADARIKAVVLDMLEYYTFASYYEKYKDNEETKYQLKEICISDETPYTEGYYINSKFYSQNNEDESYLLRPDIGSHCLDINTDNIYVVSNTSGKNREYKLYSTKRKEFRTEVYAKSILNGNTPIYKTNEFFYQPGQKELVMDYQVKSICPYNSVLLATNHQENGSDEIIHGEFPNASGSTRGELLLQGVRYLPGSFYAQKTISNGGNTTIYEWYDDCNYSISSKRDLGNSTHISVLNTISSKVVKIKKIIDQNGNSTIEELNESTLPIYIGYTSSDSGDVVYILDTDLAGAEYIYKTYEPNNTVSEKIKPNDSITFYRPGLIEDTKYSSYVKYVRQGQNLPVVPKDTDYVIRQGEYISFLWRMEDDETYKFRTYKEGDIICCTFNLPSVQIVAHGNNNTTNPSEISAFMSNLRKGSSQYDSYVQNFSLEWKYNGNEKKNSSLVEYISMALTTDTYSMSSGKSITIKKSNEVVVSNVSDRYYWVLNQRTKEDDGKYSYVLFEEGQQDYILKANEYFLYYNKQGTALYSVGYGTLIHRENTQTLGTLPQWSVPAFSYNTITDNSFYIDDVMKQNTESIRVVVKENEITEAGEGANVNLVLRNSSQAQDGIRYGIFTTNGNIIVANSFYTHAITPEATIESMVGTQSTFYENPILESQYDGKHGEWSVNFTSNGEEFTAIRYSQPSLCGLLEYKKQDSSYISVYGQNGTPQWSQSGYGVITISGDAALPVTIDNNLGLTFIQFMKKVSVIKQLEETVFVDLVDTNVSINDEKISWFNSEESKKDSGAFSQLSLQLDNEVITNLTENQSIVVEVPEDDTSKYITFSGNMEPYKDISDTSNIGIWKYEPTCVMSSPSIQTYGTLYQETTYTDTNSDEKYTKMYFYKNSLSSVDSLDVSSTTYLSGVSEITVKLNGENKTVTVPTSLPEVESNKYVFKIAVYGLPSEVESGGGISKYVSFDNQNVGYARDLSSENGETVSIYKNGQYSLYYSGEVKDIKINFIGIPNSIVTIQFSKFYPVAKPDFMRSKGDFELILNKVAKLDVKNNFDYTYEVVENDYIENPLSGLSFLNTSHLYNKFTIPQIYSIDTVITNKIM